ncbi:hypothetical protein H6P81_017186 [Aristolochia fimbriata]|uniref:Citrate transporter-like domain-containing protein n=1 Tax=Aristolochia fimbriata TaxID=158543 RepID=A0AAV7E0H0_ARIFI|nr:hypothetical protein H6P81_017186 [Aristolochia fimbriata]
MVVSVYLEQADLFKYLGKLLSYKSKGGKDLLCRICFISALSSSLITNNTTCVILTEFVLEVARENNLPAEPFLLALASSANIGSSATPIGNPANLVITVQSGISFGNFVSGLIPSMLLGIVINIVVILCMYWRLLSVEKDEEPAVPEVVVEDEMVSDHALDLSPEINGLVHTPSASRESINIEIFQSPLNSFDNDSPKADSDRIDSNRCSIASRENDELPQTREDAESKGGYCTPIPNDVKENGESFKNSKEKWKRVLFKSCVYLMTFGMLVSMSMGLNMSWTALTTALALIVVDFKDAQSSLDKVSYSLLVFFCGMFITIAGFNQTGIPYAFWSLMEPHARIHSTLGVTVFAVVILVLSNIVSSVPTVLLLGDRVAAYATTLPAAEEEKLWLIMAWVSTISGNLSLLGSAANLIVCEHARRAISGYTLSFWHHLRFGVPSTIIIVAVGLPLIELGSN